MTCVVAVRGSDKTVVLAADRGASTENTILEMATPKIFQYNRYLMGFAGSMSGDRLKYSFYPSDPDPQISLDEHMNTVFLLELKEAYDETFITYGTPDADLSILIVIDNAIYEHHSGDMSMIRLADDYVALGTGAEYAYGAFWATEQIRSTQTRAELAVGAAIKFSPTCAGKVDVLIG